MLETRQEKFRRLYHEGLQLISDGKNEEAMRILYHAAKEAPEGWLALSTELIKDGQHKVAEERCKEVLALTKDARIRAAAFNNLGMIYSACGAVDAAIAVFNESAREFPGSPDAHSNLALVCQWRQDYAGGVRRADRALELDPWHEQAQFIRAMCRLLAGDYERGFEEYECRWRSKKNGLAKLNCNMPEWDGSNGKSVFVYGEQGHGDSILMLRYAREIRKRGLRQSWVCQKNMAPLLRTIPEIDTVVEVGDPLPDFDCHLPAVSLPRVFKTSMKTIPPAPYLQKPENAMRHGRGFHVGIVWRGSAAQSNDSIRSSCLSDWRAVLGVEGVTFHSLQVDNADEALLYPKIKTAAQPKDWLDTLHRVAGLDLIIAVDTAVVHLAGAMGIPCWCALHSRPYFVYPPGCGDKTPWYNSVRLFRAEKEHDWNNVFAKIANELSRIAK